jgi:choline dehydrogenase-like flavoprotein
MPGLPIWNKRNHYALRFHAEQMPDESNCMKLSKDGDQLEIHYSVSDEDVESVIRCHEALDTYLRETNCGYLDFWHKPEELATAIRLNTIDGVHQSGTTRIGQSVADGVVDTDLKVFGTNNLYVCSSSVFPTSGQANPTFFTGVCAVRLIHHLVNNALR